MLDSFLKFLGLETKEKNPASKNWTWQKPKEKESTRIFLKIKNAIYKQTEEIIMDYDKGRYLICKGGKGRCQRQLNNFYR